MTARSEVLSAARWLADRSPDGTFTPMEVIRELQRRGSTYAESTIRTHVIEHMCANTTAKGAFDYDDLERVDRGRYRLIV